MDIKPDNAGRVSELLEGSRQARGEGRAVEARNLAATAVEAAKDIEDRRPLAEGLNALAQAERELGHAGAAIELYTRLEDLSRREKDYQAVAHAVRHLADIHREGGLTELAESLYEECLQIYRAGADTEPLDQANALRGLALLKSLARRPVEAGPLWREARAIYEVAGIKSGLDECDLWLKPLQND